MGMNPSGPHEAAASTDLGANGRAVGGRAIEGAAAPAAAPDDTLSSMAEAAGRVLALSYPLLAFSTGGRAVYQLFFKQGGLIHAAQAERWLGPALSSLACLVYLAATIGFLVRWRSAWWLSVGCLAFETLGVLVVGALTTAGGAAAATIGGTAWGHFGRDYGYFPLVQPLLGLAWLLWPATRRAYGIRRAFGGIP